MLVIGYDIFLIGFFWKTPNGDIADCISAVATTVLNEQSPGQSDLADDSIKLPNYTSSAQFRRGHISVGSYRLVDIHRAAGPFQRI